MPSESQRPACSPTTDQTHSLLRFSRRPPPGSCAMRRRPDALRSSSVESTPPIVRSRCWHRLIGRRPFCGQPSDVLLPRLPAGSEQALRPAVRVAEALSRRPRPRLIGLNLLGLQQRAVFLRSAAEACGSAANLQHDFDRWLPVLLYHRIGDDSAEASCSLSVSRQIQAPDRLVCEARLPRHSAATMARLAGWSRAASSRRC